MSTENGRFRVLVIEALPNEVFEGQNGFAKLSDVLNEEARSGWFPKDLSSSWAQGYMVFTVVLERRSEASKTAYISEQNVSVTGTPSNFAFLGAGGGLVVGIALLFFGLIRALFVSDSIVLGTFPYGGFVIPGLLVVLGLGLVVFGSYQLGVYYVRPYAGNSPQLSETPR